MDDNTVWVWHVLFVVGAQDNSNLTAPPPQVLQDSVAFE